MTSATRTGRAVVTSPYLSPGSGPLVAAPPGWTLERVAADDVLNRPGPPTITEADLLVVVGAPALGVRIAAATGARLILAHTSEREVVLPRPDEAPSRSIALPAVALDRHDPQPVLTCLVCRSPHGDALRVFSDDGRSSRTNEVILDTGDPLDLRGGIATFQPEATPWCEPAQVVADGGGTIEAVIDASRAQQGRRLRITPDAFPFRLIDRN